MSSPLATGLLEEATPPTHVDGLAVSNGHIDNGHAQNGGTKSSPNGHLSHKRPSNGHSNNGHANTNGQRAKSSSPATTRARWRIVLLECERIAPNPWQPRTLFDPDEMEELTASVKLHGVQQPVIVRTVRPKAPAEGNGTPTKGRARKAPVRYELVAGERRLRASIASGRKTIPAIVRDDLSDLQVAEIALLENVQRSNLSAIEEAKGYRRLMLDFRLSEERLARKVGKSVATLREMMKLLALPEGVQQFIRLRKLTPAHGHELLKLVASSEVCNSVAAYAVGAGLPATALSRDPLPTSRELEKRGLLVPLDYRTRFDKAQCQSCPHKAHVASGYAAYCLRPEEWNRKQAEVLEREKDEAARVLEEARRQSENQSQSGGAAEQGEGEAGDAQDGPQLPVLSQLPRSSYRDLRFGDLPEGCTSACSCRGCALDPHASGAEGEESDGSGADRSGAHVAICLNPAHFLDLQREERATREAERKRHFTTRFENALQTLQSVWSGGDTGKALTLAFTPFLEGRCGKGAYMTPRQWHELLGRVTDVLGMPLPLEHILAPDADECEVLRVLSGQDEENPVEPQRLALVGAGLLLALEAEGAARWGGQTPLLDFVLPPASGAQPELALGEDTRGEEEDSFDDIHDEDPYMEEDFRAASPLGEVAEDGEQTQHDEDAEAGFARCLDEADSQAKEAVAIAVCD